MDSAFPAQLWSALPSTTSSSSGAPNIGNLARPALHLQGPQLQVPVSGAQLPVPCLSSVSHFQVLSPCPISKSCLYVPSPFSISMSHLQVPSPRPISTSHFMSHLHIPSSCPISTSHLHVPPPRPISRPCPPYQLHCCDSSSCSHHRPWRHSS